MDLVTQLNQQRDVLWRTKAGINSHRHRYWRRIAGIVVLKLLQALQWQRVRLLKLLQSGLSSFQPALNLL